MQVEKQKLFDFLEFRSGQVALLVISCHTICLTQRKALLDVCYISILYNWVCHIVGDTFETAQNSIYFIFPSTGTRHVIANFSERPWEISFERIIGFWISLPQEVLCQFSMHLCLVVFIPVFNYLLLVLELTEM